MGLTERFLTDDEKRTMSKKEKDTILKKREKKKEEANKKSDVQFVGKHCSASHLVIKKTLRENNYDIVGTLVDLTCTKKEKSPAKRNASLLKVAGDLLQSSSSKDDEAKV